MTNLGRVIRAGRVRKGLSQAELADKIGVSQAAIGQWERGEFMPRGKHLKALADVLGGYFPVGQPEDNPDEFTLFRQDAKESPTVDLSSQPQLPGLPTTEPESFVKEGVHRSRVKIAEHRAQSAAFDNYLGTLLYQLDPSRRTHIVVEGPLSRKWVIDFLTQKSVIEVRHPNSYRRIEEDITQALWRLVVLRSMLGQGRNYVAIVCRPPPPTEPAAFEPPGLDPAGLIAYYEQKFTRLIVEADLVGVNLVLADTAEEAAKTVEELERHDPTDEHVD